jgi:hypothetical protein
VLDLNSEIENSIIIRTAAKPIAGECQVNPTSGIAGKTLFCITCSKFHDIYGDDILSYYYYERYENDQNELGNNKYVKCIIIILINETIVDSRYFQCGLNNVNKLVNSLILQIK